jgi:hypothetical protein
MQQSQFTDDDIGKTVVDKHGSEIGIVSAVKHGTAYVDPDPGITTKIKATLGWDDVDEEEGYPLQEASVETVTDDEVRLRSDL